MSPFVSRAAAVAAAVVVLPTLVLAAPSAGAAAAPACSDLELVIARGTGEPGTYGFIVGDNVFSETKKAAPKGRTVTAYAVNYPASLDAASPKAGTADLVAHVTAQAKTCPTQKFALIGYSQGAQVVDQAVGVDTTGTINGGPSTAVVPAALASRVSAVVTFGNPLTSLGKTLPAPYSANYRDFCNDGDPVCQKNAINIFAHLLYFQNAPEAGKYLAARIS